VKSWLAKGDFVFANPASQHASGKKSAFLLDEVRDFLFSIYQLDQKKYDLFFHSGATEGVNTFALSRSPDTSPLFVYAPTDHACVRMQKERFAQSCELKINAQGELLLEESIEAINAFQSKNILLNFTWVHNETGVVWPLSQALELKARTGATVHVDAPQTIGKIKDWHLLSETLDMYSFSSHKCGALKGHGWSFARKKSLSPLMLGGGQQQRLRSGTENTMAAMALMLALDELHQNWNPEASYRLMQDIRLFLDQTLHGSGARVCAQAREFNSNTALFYFNSLPSDQTLPLFDLAGLELSSGAACSSGAAKESHVLRALGLSACAKNALRLSLNWDFSEGDWGKLQPRLLQVIEKIKAKT
jgi:cysteine desulfurase